MLQCVTMRCSVLQCVVVCCSVLHSVGAGRCNLGCWQRTGVCHSVLQRVAGRCSVL